MKFELEIRNFKCFRSFSESLSNMTVLCGKNGSGKSTFIQALLLHRAALLASLSHQSEVALNGVPGLALGTVFDVLHRGGRTETSNRIELSLSHGRYSSTFDLEAREKDDESNALSIRETGRDLRVPTSPWEFTYLSAERIGPRVAQERLSNMPKTGLALGEYGENLAEVLLRFERTRIRQEVVHPIEAMRPRREQNRRLLRNLELWMGDLFGPMQIRVEANGSYAPPTVLVRVPDAVDDDWILTTNYGFGVTYCLPIVLAGLMSINEGVLIVDSPEAHLHPAAQTSIARFLATIAASGTFVVVETHSEHIVDGIRLAVADSSVPLSAKDCLVLNFDRIEGGKIDVSRIQFTSQGGLSRWPSGFFDQQTKNLRQLAGKPAPR